MKARNRIFSIDSAKAIKAQRYGWLNAIHYLAPADLSGRNICVHYSVGCKRACLGATSGMVALYKSVMKSRIAKTLRFFSNRKEYVGDIDQAIYAVKRKAARLGMKACIRLNGSSDIVWERLAPSLFANHPDVVFVEYTKIASRFDRPRPANLCLTFSRSESNEADCLRLLARGENVAVIFDHGTRPAEWHGYPVIDGDQHDLRHLDPRGVVVGLTPKGRVINADTTGFVVRAAA